MNISRLSAIIAVVSVFVSRSVVGALETTNASLLTELVTLPLNESTATPIAIETESASPELVAESSTSTSTSSSPPSPSETSVETSSSPAPTVRTTAASPPAGPIAQTTGAAEPIAEKTTSAPASESTSSGSSPRLPVEITTLAPATEGSPSRGLPEGTKTPRPSKPVPTLPPVDFDCSKKDDGYYPDPKNKCSGTYYACVGGLARRLDCAADLVYEPETGTCERRRESFRCTGTRRTTQPTTPRRPPPPPIKLVIDCTKLDDGWHADPRKKCSHTFYSCSNGVGSRFDCPGKMYFDIESKSCQAFQDVVACAGKRPPTTRKIQTTTRPRVTEKLPINCLNKPSGNYADPTKKCSQVYYVCSNGEGVKRSCADGLYYDSKKQLCDYYQEIFACVGRTRPATKTTPRPAPSPASLLSSEYNCTGKADGSYLPPGKKCSATYFRCVGGATYKINCPDGLYYDVENDLCDRWINLFVCSGKKPTSPLPTTTTKPKPTEKLPIDCSKLADGDYPDPEKKCSSTYYSCANYAGLRRICPENTYFDRTLRICDARNNVPDCTGKPRPLTTTPSTIRPRATLRLPYNCEKRTDGNYAAGKCADHYWTCVGGSTIRATCADHTFYDAELDQCGYKHEIPACGGVRPSTPEPTSTPKPSTPMPTSTQKP